MRRTSGDNSIADRGRRRSGERGAILPMAAAGIVVAVIAAALSIDLGAIAHKRRDLQKIADLAAIDGTYELDAMAQSGDWPLDVTDVPMLLAGSDPVTVEAEESARRNGLEPVDAIEFVVEIGLYERDADPEFTPCTEVLGVLALPDCAADAVRVSITDETPKYFDIGPGGAGQTTVEAISTMGTHSGLVTLTVGSFAGRVQADTSGLTTLIMSRGLEEIVDAPAGSLSADVVSYQGIASTTVTLGELAAVLTGGDVDALLSSEISYADLVNATATVLQNQGDAVAADSVLRIAQNMSTSGTYGTVEGTVVDGSGVAVAGATVTIPASTQPAITDGSGAYRVENVTAGPRTVTAEAPGYEPASTVVDVPADGTVTASPIPLAGGPYDGTPPDPQTGDGGGSLSAGTLTFDFENHLSAGDSTELNTLDLIVGTAYIANGDNAVAVELTSADLPPELAAIAAIDATIQVIEPPTTATVPTGVPVTSSQVRIEAVVTLATAYELKTGSTLVGGIAGAVTDAATGQPIPGATATLDLVGLTPATTDANGAYSIINVAAGAHTVTFDAPGYGARTEAVTVTGGQTTTLSVTLTSNLPAPGQQGNGGISSLLAPGTITGTITDSATGLPVPSVTVTMDGLVNATTDAAGVYRIVRVTNTVPHVLTVTREGYGSQLATVIVPANGTVTKNFQLDPDPVVIGQVGDGGVSVLDTTLETSQVKIPFLVELARASAVANDIQCPTSANLTITSGAATWGVGTPDGDYITSPAVPAYPSELDPVDVLLSGLVTGVAEMDPFDGFPATSVTEWFEEGDRYTTAVVPPGAIPAEVDSAIGQPLADELDVLLEVSDLLATLTPDALAANLALLRSTIEDVIESGTDGQAEILTLIDAIGSAFGVGLLGADVTLDDVICSPGVTGNGVRAPMLVE